MPDRPPRLTEHAHDSINDYDVYYLPHYEKRAEQGGYILRAVGKDRVRIEVGESLPSLEILDWNAEVRDWTYKSDKYRVVQEAKPDGIHSDARIYVAINVGETEPTPPRDTREPDF